MHRSDRSSTDISCTDQIDYLQIDHLDPGSPF